MRVRLSYGTAVSMGLIRAKLLARPTTAYLMTYYEGRCINDCKFCAQARSSRANLEMLSRVVWPAFELETVLKNFSKGNFKRICLQTIDYPNMLSDVFSLLEELSKLNVPISLSITPVPRSELEEFSTLGVDYIGVGLDAASERVYKDVKISRYSWDDMWKFFDDVLSVFGKGRAVVHLIVGLGETDKEIVETIGEVYKKGGIVSLFAFTPIKGTQMENFSPPPLERYRKIQVAHYLIKTGEAELEDFEFDEFGNLIGLPKTEVPPIAYVTQGCPWCNRPYYNERPGREPYNYPSVEMVRKRK
ncbi:radical SAM protein [Pyrococcus abyssi]|uniref:Biotin synthase n=1 Tax=Pyrococcus abyssi (strain GE5 / Orsay) TaxID=272844 RepID=Q9V260_PYRAB|nr:radical SAM protein [Pyrococcus abyssi]CAB49138.1 Biotin synthase related protein [Pyrococcus abyssi GE5]CCE69590.1 TPA: biotin synthase [Pyrococcus abyssi GE5]